jgi:hypothetical protein
MTDASREAFEAWHAQRARQIQARAEALANERIAAGLSNSGPTRKHALMDAIQEVDDSGWAAWQAGREAALGESIARIDQRLGPRSSAAVALREMTNKSSGD